MGFEGKWAIHPSQIDLANEVFTPSEAEVTKARRILEAMQEAAKAGRAAAAQGKFAEFKHELYSASKDISGHPEFGIEDFMKFAQKAGVKDLKKFRQEATDDTYSEVIETATSYASQIGISGTPAFVVGDQFIGGAQPAEAFDQVIQEQLGKASNA